MKLTFIISVLLVLINFLIVSCGNDVAGYPGNIREDFRGTWLIKSDGNFDGKKIQILTGTYSLSFGTTPYSGDFNNNNFTGDFSDTYSDGVTSQSDININITADSSLSGVITFVINYPDSTRSTTQHFTGKKQ